MTTPVIIPTLTTSRLRLEPLCDTHSDGMFRLWSDPLVCRYSGTVTDYDRNVIQMPASTRASSDRIIEFWIRAAQDGWGFRWAVIVSCTDEFAGTVGFNSLGGCSEIAYHLLPRQWGRGVMFEASRAAVDWRRDHGASEIEAFIEPENAASIALAVRIGMRATDAFSADGAQRYRMAV